MIVTLNLRLSYEVRRVRPSSVARIGILTAILDRYIPLR